MSVSIRSDSERVFAQWFRHMQLMQRHRARQMVLSARTPSRMRVKRPFALRPNPKLSRFGAWKVLYGALKQVAPIVNGALRVFLPSQTRAAALRVPSHTTLCTSSARNLTSRLGNYAATRARLPRGPSLHVSMSHGAGLQHARAFSTGGAAPRLFENVITNAPLALRTFGKKVLDELDLPGDVNDYAFATAMKSQRGGVRRVYCLDDLGLASLCVSRVDALNSKTDCTSFDDDLEALDVFFPLEAPTLCGPFPGVMTQITLPLKPSINAFDTAILGNAVQDGHFLDSHLQLNLGKLRSCYKRHRKCLELIEETLRIHGMWPTNLNLSHLELQAGDSSAEAMLKINLSGWRRCDVEQVLAQIAGHVHRFNTAYVPWFLEETGMNSTATLERP